MIQDFWEIGHVLDAYVIAISLQCSNFTVIVSGEFLFASSIC